MTEEPSRNPETDSYVTPCSITKKCLGDITTHRVVVGQIWQNATDPNQTIEILKVHNRKEIDIKLCYEDWNTQKQMCDILDKTSVHFTLRDCILIKE